MFFQVKGVGKKNDLDAGVLGGNDRRVLQFLKIKTFLHFIALKVQDLGLLGRALAQGGGLLKLGKTGREANGLPMLLDGVLNLRSAGSADVSVKKHAESTN